jgi:carboxyl-terminal processing protease
MFDIWKSRFAIASPQRRNANALITVLIGIGLFLAGYALGSTSPARPAHAQTGTPEDLEALFTPFWETWSLLHGEFVDQPLDDVALIQGAIRGMVETLDDQHTAYMNPEEYALLDSDLSGSFEGIGAEVEHDDGKFIIVATMDGSPAQSAGLQSGDRIMAVDGEDVRDMEQFDVLTRVRGPAGTPVTLTIRRAGMPGTTDVVIVRAEIIIEDVRWRIVEGDIAYVRLAQFSASADTNLRSSLSEVLALQPTGLVLDLRGNSGGLLDVAINITGEFIAEGTLMGEQWGDGNERAYRADGDGVATTIPLVVLVDEGSASASEVLAIAIQDHQRGIVVGETTFGKGTVQTWQGLSDGGGLRVTSARWVSPEGTWIHEEGVQPDVLVEWSGPRASQLEEDVQLNAAIDVLRGYSLWPTWPLPWLDVISPALVG